jgi:hypothetical protein
MQNDKTLKNDPCEIFFMHAHWRNFMHGAQ